MAFTGSGKIWMNGSLVEWADAKIHIASHVIHYGSGVFEGARCYDTPRGSACFRLDTHMKRLFDSARIYRMQPQVSQAVLTEAGLETIRAKTSANYANSQLIKMEAIAEGYSEGIALDTFGYLSEGSGQNLFVGREGVLYTPPLTASILPGITRDSVITIARDLGYRVREEMLPRELLYIADEAFFAGTAVEITPIKSVDKIAIGNGRRGPITEAIQTAFFD